MFATFQTLITYCFTTQLQLSNRKCLTCIYYCNLMENPWNGDTTYHVAREITKQVLRVKKLLAIISMQYYHPNSLWDEMRWDQSIILIPYIHFNTATTLVDSTTIILLFQKCWIFFKKIYFQVLNKKIVRENIESLRLFYLPKWHVKRII
jgi:hypothetical protein